MFIKKIGIIFFLILSFLPAQNTFAQTENVGIIPANIWYSKDPFEEGDKIKIYTVVYNADTRELSGTVIFFDYNIFLGKTNFSVSGKSTTYVSINWTVTAGNHTIFAKIENAKFLISKDKYEEVYLAENKTEESKVTISKKVVSNISNNINDKVAGTTNIISNAVDTVKSNTPPIVTNTINTVSDSLESIRTNLDSSTNINKEKIQNEINVLNKVQDSPEKEISLDKTTNKETLNIYSKIKSKDTTNLVQKPFKYVELFFLTIFSYIFKYKILFYGLIIFIIFIIIRYIWRLIF